ncbi:energy-coupling factor transport system ATP-binding protein [Oribacterium sp. KHPX15]|uniref:ABC transporter ATP-binding protein n=1 Tax=Oribacterium sp. KHPX15 TaxID=1855342 RepID=UPI0008963628|nr:energy-coupling factor transporter ATPase [Oribacterium sp. KHPX15]SEA36318.1 energy-coupling factor transport system ATP-binding protein [Oribacterium sp. KHPX15]
MSYIEIKNLKYRYPGATELALNDVSLNIEKGEFIGIAGENGAGKSTLSQALPGLIPQFYKGAYGGQVLIDGLNAKTTPTSELCQKAGLVFQNPFNQLSGAKDTVYDEVGFGLQNLGINPDLIRSRIENVLRRFGIWEFRDRNPFDLSGGQLQRVAIASVLAMEPEVLILDEPTSQLDPAGSEEVFRTVDELTKSGITIIMIEQKLEKLAEYCDRIVLLHEGKLVAFDTPGTIFSRKDLSDYGMCAPAFTEFARKNALRNADGIYPVTKAETLALIKEGQLDTAELLKSLRDMSYGAPDITMSPKAPATNNLEPNSPASSNSPAINNPESCDTSPDVKKEKAVSEGQSLTGRSQETFTVSDLHFSYVAGTEVFKGLNLDFDMRSTAIIGQNGAGKTTLVRILKGLLKPDSGSLTFRGQNLGSKTVAELAKQVGYVFQNPDDQIFKYTVIEEVMFGPLNIGMTKEEAEAHAHDALKIVGLDDFCQKNPYDLELSDRKLVAIASVLAMNPDVLILDEPTIAQDHRGKEKIKEIIRSEASKGKLVIAILHDMDFVADTFDRVIAMAHGEVLLDGSPEEIFTRGDILEKASLAPPHLISLMNELSSRNQ